MEKIKWIEIKYKKCEQTNSENKWKVIKFWKSAFYLRKSSLSLLCNWSFFQYVSIEML